MKRALVRRFFVTPIFLYQKTLFYFTSGHCRFYPSCSQYAIDAILERGVFVGSFLALRRLLRCCPLTPGGYDPVPSKKSASSVAH